jgi:hypothetical protein
MKDGSREQTVSCDVAGEESKALNDVNEKTFSSAAHVIEFQAFKNILTHTL